MKAKFVTESLEDFNKKNKGEKVDQLSYDSLIVALKEADTWGKGEKIFRDFLKNEFQSPEDLSKLDKVWAIASRVSEETDGWYGTALHNMILRYTNKLKPKRVAKTSSYKYESKVPLGYLYGEGDKKISSVSRVRVKDEDETITVTYGSKGHTKTLFREVGTDDWYDGNGDRAGLHLSRKKLRRPYVQYD